MKPLCYAPFIGLYASNKDGYAPCCVSKKFNDAGPEQFWSGEVMSRIRKSLLLGEFPDSCGLCAKKVANRLTSDVDYWAHEYKMAGEPDTSDPKPIILDYRPSNQCNLKCRMCGSAASSSIENEVEANPGLAKWYGKPKPELNINDKMIEYVQSLDLLKVKILGGEPSIDPGVWDFMAAMANRKRKPTLKVTTNATSINPKFIELLKKFDKLEMTFSVDAIGDTYDYIRTNARWKNTERNILSFMSSNDCKVSFNVVLTPFNIFSLDKLVDWFYDLWFRGYKFKVNFDDSDDLTTSLSSVLVVHVDDALNSLNIKKLQAIGSLELISILEKSEFDHSAHESFKRFAAALDRVRKTRLTDLDYRFHEYIEEASI